MAGCGLFRAGRELAKVPLTGRQCGRRRNNYLAGAWRFLAWRSSRLAVEGRDDQRIETGRTKRGLRSMTVSRGAEQALPDDRILAEMTRRFRALIDGGFPYFVASLEGRVIGYAYAGPYRPRPAYRFTVENSVYLQPAIHRRGIGLQLMQRLIAECERRGYRQMIAVIGDSANAGSIGVHTRCGFQMIGTHPNVGLKFGRWLDTVMMQLPLGEGGTTVPADESKTR